MNELTRPEASVTARSLAHCLWVFASLGPVFGYVTFMTLLTLSEAESMLHVLGLPLALVLAAPFGIPFAWVVGLVPALLVGIGYWWLRAKAGVGAWAAVAWSAASAVFICAGAIVVIDGSFAGLGDATSWAVMIVPGVVATCLCVAVIERRS